MASSSSDGRSEEEQPLDVSDLLHSARATSFRLKAEMHNSKPSFAIMHFAGAFENRDARVLRNVLAALNRRSYETVILDLSGVARIGSTSLAALLMFVKERESLKNALACPLVLPDKSVREKVATLGLAPLFEIFESLDDAVYVLGFAPDGKSAGFAKSGSSNMNARVKMLTSTPRTAIVTLAGYIQELEAGHLSWLFRQVGKREARNIIIDTAGLSYVNLSAIRVLMSVARIWFEAYGERCVAFAGANLRVRNMIGMFGGSQYYHVAENVEKAKKLLRRANLSQRSGASEVQSGLNKIGGAGRSYSTL